MVAKTIVKTVDAEPKKQYIITNRRVDKFNTIRKRVLLSPAICRECGEDLLALNSIEEPWEELPKSQQTALMSAMKDHELKTHSRAQALLVDEDEIAGAWLGDKRGGTIPMNEMPAEVETLKKIKEKKGR